MLSGSPKPAANQPRHGGPPEAGHLARQPQLHGIQPRAAEPTELDHRRGGEVRAGDRGSQAQGLGVLQGRAGQEAAHGEEAPFTLTSSQIWACGESPQ